MSDENLNSDEPRVWAHAQPMHEWIYFISFTVVGFGMGNGVRKVNVRVIDKESLDFLTKDIQNEVATEMKIPLGDPVPAVIINSISQL